MGAVSLSRQHHGTLKGEGEKEKSVVMWGPTSRPGGLGFLSFCPVGLSHLLLSPLPQSPA